jgi:hypothetical protein
MFQFRCYTCNEEHEGIPSFSWDYPANYLYIPIEEREQRCELSSDWCIIDREQFFIRGSLEIPVIDSSEPFVWGAWVSLSERNFKRYLELYEEQGREQEEPFFGWLCSMPSGYPERDIKTMVYLRPVPNRPYIELEPTDHPLSIEQREGITLERVQQILEELIHPDNAVLPEIDKPAEEEEL